MKDILNKYIQDKLTRHPLNGSKLSTSKRTERMFEIVQDTVYGVKYTKEERILASQLITEILKELD